MMHDANWMAFRRRKTRRRQAAVWSAACVMLAVMCMSSLGWAASSIRVGQTVDGTLSSRDNRLDSGEYFDEYELRLDAGDSVRIELSSRAFDAYLLVRGDGVSLDDDDGGPSPRGAAIAYTASRATTLRVVATSYSAGETGSYRLAVQRAGRADAAPAGGNVVVASGNTTGGNATGGASSAGANTVSAGPPASNNTVAASDASVGTSAPTIRNRAGVGGTIVDGPPVRRNQAQQEAETRNASSVTPLVVGQKARGTLAAGDAQLNSGEWYDRFVLEGEQGQRIRITLRGDGFEPYVLIRGHGLSQDASYAARSRAAVLDVTLPQAGAYEVAVTSSKPRESGAYEVLAEQVGDARARDVAATRLAPGRPVQGTLESGDLQRTNGQYLDRFQFRGKAGQTVQIDVNSRDFDTYLFLTGPDGSGEENDDISASDLNSSVVFTLPVDGDYEVLVSSSRRGETGRYTVVMKEVQVTPSVRPTASGAGAQTLTLGRIESAALTVSDQRIESGERMDPYLLAVRAGQSYEVRMESSEFDAWLELRSEGGVDESNDDATPGATDAAVTFTAPQTETVSIYATSARAGELGRYTIVAREISPSARQAVAPSGHGRVIAVMVGISDYGGAGDLPLCAEDALRIREALGSTGMLAPESTILLNKDATRAEIAAAFRRAAAATTPNDVFLFFYSGHGNRVPTRDASEYDRFSETLVLSDHDELLDKELAAMLDSIQSRLTIVALDSCFSGGFRQQVNTDTRRVGIFSSEEDVVSAVATRFRAGGYLSYFLAQALTSAADVSPRDGQISVLELTQYIRRQWSERGPTESVPTGDDDGAYQNLVIERGAKTTEIVVGIRR